MLLPRLRSPSLMWLLPGMIDCSAGSVNPLIGACSCGHFSVFSLHFHGTFNIWLVALSLHCLRHAWLVSSLSLPPHAKKGCQVLTYFSSTPSQSDTVFFYGSLGHHAIPLACWHAGCYGSSPFSPPSILSFAVGLRGRFYWLHPTTFRPSGFWSLLCLSCHLFLWLPGPVGPP